MAKLFNTRMRWALEAKDHHFKLNCCHQVNSCNNSQGIIWGGGLCLQATLETLYSKQRKEKKNRTKKVRGTAKAKVGTAGKK